MRRWRVGSISMGLSLVLLGILLFITQVKGAQIVEPLLVWWPLILVVLGIEIIVYLFLSKQEHPVVKYDFISIFFVGIIGTIGIVFTILSSVGILSEVKKLVGAEHTSINLPAIVEPLPSNIKRVVLETNNQSVHIEGTEANELHIFGTYRSNVNREAELPITSKEDYSLMKVIGDTMYVNIKEPSNQSGPFSTYTSLNPTIVVPNSVQLEVRGDYNRVELYPGAIENNWNVSDASYVTVNVSKKSDLSLSVVSNNDLRNGNVKWDNVETNQDNNNVYKGTMKFGEGTYQLNIFNSDDISVNIIDEL